MKVRNGFVTNSSSSCFIVNFNQYPNSMGKYDIKTVRFVLHKILDSYNKIHGTNVKYSQAFGYVGIPDKKKLMKAFSNACWGNGDSPYSVYDESTRERYDTNMTYLDLASKGDFVIFSREDNSIPWEIHSYICDVLGAIKFHLG